MFQSTFENWADNVETLGKFEDFGDFKVEKAGKTVTCTQQVEFSKRSGQMVYSYTVIGDRMKLKAMNVNVNYTLGETMGKAALNVLMGMAVVFSILILISLMLGKGLRGIFIGVALTHWPSLTRIIRAEVMQIRSSQYIQVSRQFGKSTFFISRNHIIPHVFPQLLVGLILLFPHAILHEASITFLGFGLPLDMPAIGVILSEAMKYLSLGRWWLTIFPGATLLIVVLMIDAIGETLRTLLNPVSAQE